MTPDIMLKHCKIALEKLDEIEAHATELPAEQLEWLYSGIRAAKELRHIARTETINQMTTQQADHITLLMTDCDMILANVLGERSADD